MTPRDFWKSFFLMHLAQAEVDAADARLHLARLDAADHQKISDLVTALQEASARATHLDQEHGLSRRTT